jgi:glutathione S-transferase
MVLAGGTRVKGPLNSRPMTARYTLFGEDKLDSPFVFTAYVALKEKGVPFDLRLLDLAQGEQRAPEFARRSFTRRVPTLEVGAFALSESVAIVEYLEETLPPPSHPRLLPATVEGRARARQVLGWLRTDLAALRRARPSESIFFERVTTPLDAAAKKDVAKLVQVATELVGTTGAVTGEFSIADADLAFALQRLHANGDELPPVLVPYVETVWRRPSVAAWVALERPATSPVIAS